MSISTSFVSLVLTLLQTADSVQAGTGLHLETTALTPAVSLETRPAFGLKISTTMTTTVTFKSLTYIFLPMLKRKWPLNPY